MSHDSESTPLASIRSPSISSRLNPAPAYIYKSEGEWEGEDEDEDEQGVQVRPVLCCFIC